VPTIAESGLPGYEALVWFGLFAPAGTPGDIVTRLSSEVAKIVRHPNLTEAFRLQGLTPVGSSSADFTTRVRKEYELWGKVVRDAGIKLD
jgi:tripartite-type tricarboxylate transporter receptor subunit TctC